jgi:hypothetical protein
LHTLVSDVVGAGIEPSIRKAVRVVVITAPAKRTLAINVVNLKSTRTRHGGWMKLVMSRVIPER